MELPLLRLRPGQRKHISIREADKTKAQVVADALQHHVPSAPLTKLLLSEKQTSATPRGPESTTTISHTKPQSMPPVVTDPTPPHPRPKEIVRGLDHHHTPRETREGSSRRKRSTASSTMSMKARSPDDVLQSAEACELTMLELSEIRAFPNVYYFGTADTKTRTHGVSNDGYDDDKGDYIVNLHDHIAYRYDVVGHLGRGSFGQVLKCHDVATRQMVALKIVRNKQKFQEQSIVEVQLLQHLNESDVETTSNVITMLDSFTFRNHLCLVFELLSINLYEYLKLEQFRGLPLPLIRKIATELLQCLVFLQAHNVIHCDLKPENILLRKPKSTQIAVIDFGSSCFHNATFFTYIQSRFYRAPEVIMGLPYGMPIDMWSFGCIVAELFTGYPVFPGENEAEQLSCIMEVFDVPPKHMIDKCKRRKNYFDESGTPTATTNSRGRRRRPASREFRALIKCQDAKLVDLLTKCFRWDPTTRYTPMEAIDHEWITQEKKQTTSSASTTSTTPTTQPKQPDKQPEKPPSTSLRSSFAQTFLRKATVNPQPNDEGRVELTAILPKI
ncbi:Aste57867_2271 [Aphanomyces stellatus]|uniref:dual-specificity kinase n=1 Tax=Aphanomyces stellatus TaxID=120398 RepID=A0A485KCE0_9STRA|nr:hypothetical protein As57867_002266 [Aphanomyces stellatus]VFT79474.1 Aste57867_2271 [Aphanomyces stellatus]